MIPATSQLRGVLHNPLRSIGAIAFGLHQAGHARLSLFDMRGRHVRVLVNERKPAGEYLATWDTCNDAGDAVPSGLYLARLEIDGRSMMCRVSVMR